jgi:hypothetical protein
MSSKNITTIDSIAPMTINQGRFAIEEKNYLHPSR